MKTLYWNSRGGCVELLTEKASAAGIKNGFIPLTEEEETKYKPGSYHPGHDEGSSVVVLPQKNKPETDSLKKFWVIEL